MRFFQATDVRHQDAEGKSGVRNICISGGQVGGFGRYHGCDFFQVLRQYLNYVISFQAADFTRTQMN